MLRVGVLLSLLFLNPPPTEAAEPSKVEIKHTTDQLTGAQRIVATGLIEGSLEEVRKAILEFNHYAEFMPGFRESSLLAREAIPVLADADSLRKMSEYFKAAAVAPEAGKVWYWYQRIDFPWPVPDRCAILEVNCDADSLRPGQVIRSRQVIGMFATLEGGWELEAVDEGVIATYHALADPDILIPGFVQRIGLDFMLPDVFRAISLRVIKNREGPK